MIEGLWILKILPPPVTTGGVVVFANKKVFGGDNGFSWVGTYSSDERIIKGRVHVHNFDPEIKSVLEVAGDYDMHFSGNIQGDTITGTAIIANQPQHRLSIRLEKRAPL